MKKSASLFLTAVMLAAMLSVSGISAFAKEQYPQENSKSAFTAETCDEGKGSTLSEGSLTVICSVAAAVVFGLGGFFIGKAAGKKKKPATADGSEKENEK